MAQHMCSFTAFPISHARTDGPLLGCVLFLLCLITVYKGEMNTVILSFLSKVIF